jgi:uncharacterized protein YkwD
MTIAVDQRGNAKRNLTPFAKRNLTPFLAFATPRTALRRAVRTAPVWALALLAASMPAAAQPGPAPQRFEAQRTRGWSHEFVPKAAKTRDQVVSLYHATYVPGSTAALAWTGSVGACNPGSTNVEHQQAVITRINYFRALVDLPPVTLLTGVERDQVQAAALMMAANNQLSHQPPTTWLCYTAAGAAGAMNANIYLGRNGVLAVDGYIDDPGTGNEAAGHRRWLLFPPRAAMTTGDLPGSNTPPRPTNAIYVFGPRTTRPATPNGTAWPPAGFVPYQNLPAVSNRWSFSFPDANFSGATVTMSGPGGAIATVLEPLATGYGDNTIVFRPTGVSYAQPASDTTYMVTINGITGTGAPSAVQYTVTVIDPGTAPPPAETVEVVEFYNTAPDHYFITWIPAEIANLDAGRTPTRWTRTGATFKAYTTAQAGTSDICRYYIPPALGDSHFFGRGTTECTATGVANPSFVLEEPRFMFLFLPTAGVCPPGTIAVHRTFSNRADANHRYMVDPALRDQMVARGWLAEGDGPNLVVMCAPA